MLLPARRISEQSSIELRAIDLSETCNPIDRLIEAIDSDTRMVFVSHVSYRTGRRLDIDALAKQIRDRSDACIAVDASQSLGVIPVAAQSVDFVVATAFKWLLGAHGVAILGWNRQNHPSLRPSAIGWHSVDDMDACIVSGSSGIAFKHSAERFELGNPPYQPIFSLSSSLGLLQEFDPLAITSHPLALSAKLIAGLQSLQAPVLTPHRCDERAGIVAWEDPQCASTAQRLRAMGIQVTGGAGRIRASMHLYNGASDIDALLDAYQSLQGI